MIELNKPILIKALKETVEGIKTFQKLLPNIENGMCTYQKIERSNATLKDLQELIRSLELTNNKGEYK